MHFQGDPRFGAAWGPAHWFPPTLRVVIVGMVWFKLSGYDLCPIAVFCAYPTHPLHLSCCRTGIAPGLLS